MRLKYRSAVSTCLVITGLMATATSAQVAFYSTFRTQFFDQVAEAKVVLRNANVGYGISGTALPTQFTSAVVDSPLPGTIALSGGETSVGFNEGGFATYAALETAYPPGPYTFTLNGGPLDGRTAVLTVPATPNFAMAPPCVINFTQLDNFDVADGLNVQIEPLMPAPVIAAGIAANDPAFFAGTFVTIVSPSLGQVALTDFLPLGSSVFAIPPNALDADETYTLTVAHSSRVLVTGGFGQAPATGVVGFDDVTETSFTTRPATVLDVPLGRLYEGKLPAAPGTGVTVEVFNGLEDSIVVGEGVPKPLTLAGRTPTAVFTASEIAFPTLSETAPFGSTFDAFFDFSAVTPPSLSGVTASQFTIAMEGLLLVDSSIDANEKTGQIETGLRVGSDDGFYLFIGDRFIGQAGNRAYATSTFSLRFPGSGLYPFRLLYRSSGVGESGVALEWNNPQTKFTWEAIPRESLYPLDVDCAFDFPTFSPDLITDSRVTGSFDFITPKGGDTFEDILIGVCGNGEVQMFFGFDGFAERVRIGAGPGTTGSMVINSPSTNLLAPRLVSVGSAGFGSLSVTSADPTPTRDGARGGSQGNTETSVETEAFIVGEQPGSEGVVLVDESGTALIGLGTSRIVVGDLGRGTLRLRNGATATSTLGLVGAGSGSEGLVRITAGSSWSIDNALVLGGRNNVLSGDTASMFIDGTSNVGAQAIFLHPRGTLRSARTPGETNVPVAGSVFSDGIVSAGDSDPAAGQGTEFAIEGSLQPRFGRFGQIELDISALEGPNGPVAEKLVVSGALSLGGTLVLNATQPLTLSSLDALPEITIIDAGSIGGPGLFNAALGLPLVTGPNNTRFVLRPEVVGNTVVVRPVPIEQAALPPLADATTFTGDPSSFIASGRLDADAFDDLVVVQPAPNDADAPGTITVLFSDGDGGFSRIDQYSSGAIDNEGQTGRRPRSVAIGDFNADGNNDIVIGNRGGNPDPMTGLFTEEPNIQVRLNDGAGEFSNFAAAFRRNFPPLFARGVGGARGIGTPLYGEPIDVLAAEFMSPDGSSTSADDAAVVLSFGGGVPGQVNIYSSGASGSGLDDDWDEVCTLPTGPRPAAADVIDLDGSGGGFGNGLAIAETEEDNVRVIANTDPVRGAFGAVADAILIADDGPADVRAADFDGDGLPDLVALAGIEAESARLRTFRNTGGPEGLVFVSSTPVVSDTQLDPDSTSMSDDPSSIAIVPTSPGQPPNVFVIASSQSPAASGTLSRGGPLVRVVRQLTNISEVGFIQFISPVTLAGSDPAGFDAPSLLADGDADGTGGDDLFVIRNASLGDMVDVDVLLSRCIADVVDPVGLDVGDVIVFVKAFTASESLADLFPPGGDGVFNVNDVIDFVTAFSGGAGCP